jgi:hypothetical protein
MAGKRKTSRYIVMSIPGRRDDGKDTWWFVFDSRLHKSVPDAMLRGESGRTKLAILARAMNAAPTYRSRSPSKSQATGRRHREVASRR